MNPYSQGRLSFELGQPICYCPYEESTREEELWIAGYTDAEDDWYEEYGDEEH